MHDDCQFGVSASSENSAFAEAVVFVVFFFFFFPPWKVLEIFAFLLESKVFFMVTPLQISLPQRAQVWAVFGLQLLADLSLQIAAMPRWATLLHFNAQ